MTGVSHILQGSILSLHISTGFKQHLHPGKWFSYPQKHMVTSMYEELRNEATLHLEDPAESVTCKIPIQRNKETQKPPPKSPWVQPYKADPALNALLPCSAPPSQDCHAGCKIPRCPSLSQESAEDDTLQHHQARAFQKIKCLYD